MRMITNRVLRFVYRFNNYYFWPDKSGKIIEL